MAYTQNKEKVLFQCKDVSLGYENRAIIEHLDFVVKAGDYVCIVGENGSGKSTLLKTLLGLIKPVWGKIWQSKAVQEGKIGYLPQQTEIQRQFPASVTEVVLSGFLNQISIRPFFSRTEKQQAIAVMQKLGIAALKNKCYASLSGGQQQRVLLARALCAAQDILVLDEPVTGLDPMAAAAMYETLRILNREGMAIVMVTHDLRNAVLEADSILHLNEGEYFFGTVQEYKESAFVNFFADKADRKTGICMAD